MKKLTKQQKKEIIKKGLEIRKKFWVLWGSLDSKILEKFKNINGKTGRYGVPEALFQKRTSRRNRVLLRWKLILKNNLTFKQLETFYGGVCVEFVNDDFFSKENHRNPLFKKLEKKIGSDDKISAILSFRNEEGDPGATIARQSFEKFRKLSQKKYSKIERNPAIRYSGRGDNSVWKGNLFYSIRGGSQTSQESHSNDEHQRLFNPALDYANEKVCLDIDIAMSYFAMHCYHLNENIIKNFNYFKKDVETYLNGSIYDNCNLLDYCNNHYSLKFGNGKLIDPIQLTKISINDFKLSRQENGVVVCHNESVNKNIFHIDRIQKCILSPARPTNLFWAKDLSNMMQQNYTLEEYFDMEKNRFLQRKRMMDKISKKKIAKHYKRVVVT